MIGGATMTLAGWAVPDTAWPRSLERLSTPTDDRRLRDRALGGDVPATRELVGRLVPVIQARVARCLLRHGRPGARRNVREEVADLTQEVLLSLFAGSGRILATWNPDRGLSLQNFVGLVAQRQAVSLLRTRRRSPWAEEPTEDLGPLLPDAGTPEARMASKQTLEALLAWLEDTLSPMGLELFQLLLVQDLGAAEVATRTGLSIDAVYAWRSRLEKLLRQRAANLDGAPRPRAE
jgi:RNA polymerase sigma-70 factor (ECF subfamily)